MLLRDDVSTCEAPAAEDPLWIKRGGIKTSYGRHVNRRWTVCNPLRGKEMGRKRINGATNQAQGRRVRVFASRSCDFSTMLSKWWVDRADPSSGGWELLRPQHTAWKSTLRLDLGRSATSDCSVQISSSCRFLKILKSGETVELNELWVVVFF